MISDNQISTAHFRSRLFREPGASRKLPLEDIFNRKSMSILPHNAKKRFVEEGLVKDICENCGLGPEWQGQPLTLRMGFRDGENRNYALENIRILCPNCYTQIETRTPAAKRGEESRKAKRLAENGG
jgi:hypothetical protein